MGDVRNKITEKPAVSGLLARMQESAKTRERVFVVLSDGLCLEFRPPRDDGEYDRLTAEAKRWAQKRASKSGPVHLLNVGPRSATRFGMCHVAAALMVGAYPDGYETDEEGEIVPAGEMSPPLTFEEWLRFAKEHYQQFDAILAAVDRESVRAVQVSREEELESEGKG